MEDWVVEKRTPWCLTHVIVTMALFLCAGTLQSAPAADEAKDQFAHLKKKVPGIVESFLKNPDGFGGDLDRTTNNGVTTQTPIEWRAAISEDSANLRK
jgi:hypothetical protein